MARLGRPALPRLLCIHAAGHDPSCNHQAKPMILRSSHYVRLASLIILFALVAAALGRSQPVGAQSGSLPQIPFARQQLFTVIGNLNASNGAPQENSSVIVHKGLVIEVYSQETNSPTAGIAVFDFSNPSAPRLVAHTEENTQHFSEQHAIGLASIAGHDYAALLAVDGTEIWDWSDLTRPTRVAHLQLPGIAVGYGLGAWWLAWQAPYLYVSGASNGIYIVDVSDPAHPVLVDRGGEPNPIPNSATGGFRVGPVFAIGNLMVISANDGRGYATLDISDPVNPELLDSFVNGAPESYSAMVNGYRIYAAGTDDDFHGLDISNPANIVELDSVPMGGKGGYLMVQDGFAHVGASNHYVKVDLADDSDYRIVGSASSNVAGHDEDFAVPLGNLVVLSDDHYNGSFIFPHQADPDHTGPVVSMVSPLDGAAGQSRSTRIGFTFSDLIDLTSLNPSTVSVEPIGEEPLEGIFSTQAGIVNFAPEKPLAPDTTYEIVVPADGVRDISGNPTPREFRATFSTSEDVRSALLCSLNSLPPVLVGEQLDMSVSLSRGIGGESYTWDFGDDTPAQATGAAPAAGHSWSAPGHYTVRVTVTAGRQRGACAALATVYDRDAGGVAPSSSPIILDHSGTQVWTVNPDNDTVTAINAVTRAQMFERPVGGHPRTLAQAPDGTMWVVNEDDASISVLDSATGTLLTTIPLAPGSRPYAILFHPGEQAAFITLQATGRLLKLDARSRSVVADLDIGPSPRSLALTQDGRRLFVTRFISPDDHGEIVEIDPVALRVVKTIPLAFDPGPDTESSGRGVPNGLQGLAVSPDGRSLWVSSKKDNIARGLLRDGQALTFETTVRAIISRIDLASSSEDLAARHDFNNREGAVAVAFSPHGDYLFVALQGSNAVDVLDAYSGQLVTTLENVGRAPQGMVFTSDGSQLYVQSFLNRSVFVYDVRNILTPGSRRAMFLVEIPTVAAEKLAPQVLAGKRIFYNAADSRMSRDGYLACSSCHLDSAEDGRVWDKSGDGEGLRNTISLLGHAGNGEGLLHWSANFDEIQDFEHDMRGPFGGSGFMSDSDFNSAGRNRPLGSPKAGFSPELDALAAYVNSLDQVPLSPYRTNAGGLTEDGIAGRAIFAAMRCTACHGGPAFTDSDHRVRHDVGTLTQASGLRLGQPLLALDTPTLRGLWLSPPYLHDGSAPTLRDVFTTRNQNGLHGDLAALLADDPRALDKLVSYLQQIDVREPAFAVPPVTVTIARPLSDATLQPGVPVEIGVDTTLLLGPADGVEFFVDGQVVGRATTPVYAWMWTPTSGPHTLTAELVYANGVRTLSAPLQVTVEP